MLLAFEMYNIIRIGRYNMYVKYVTYHTECSILHNRPIMCHAKFVRAQANTEKCSNRIWLFITSVSMLNRINIRLLSTNK